MWQRMSIVEVVNSSKYEDRRCTEIEGLKEYEWSKPPPIHMWGAQEVPFRRHVDEPSYETNKCFQVLLLLIAGL